MEIKEDVITVIQKGNKLRFVMINDEIFANKWVDISNELLKKGENKWVATTLDLFGEICNKNEIYVIFNGNEPIQAYINQQNKAENTLKALSESNSGTYKLQVISNIMEVE